MLQELRHAIRVLAKNPAFTTVAAVSLALGIGANSAIFSLADALLLRPLPVKDAGAVVAVQSTTPEGGMGFASFPDFRDWRDRSRSFDDMVAFQLTTGGFAESSTAIPQMRAGMLASNNLFRAMGVEPTIGRAFSPTEGVTPGKDAIIVLSHDFWRDQFASDRSVVGRTVRLNGLDFQVIGIAPESFTGMDQYFRPSYYAPLTMAQRLAGDKEDANEKRDSRRYAVRGRLKSGVTREAAQAELAGIAANLEREYPAENRHRSVTVRTELDARIKQSPPDAALVAGLMFLVGLVLLIACANVANLLLARARGRTREIAVRLAIGASRMQLVRQLMLESLVLAALACGLGVIIGFFCIEFLRTFKIPSDIPIVFDPRMNVRVLLFSMAVSAVSALAAGLVPAWRAASPSLVPALRSASAGSSARVGSIGRNILIIGEIAMAMVLLVAAGMLVDGFRKMLVLNPGFRTDHLLTMDFDPSLAKYTAEQSQSFYRYMRERGHALPGVKSVSLLRSVPFAPMQMSESVAPEGYQFAKGQESDNVMGNVVDENFFDTFRTPILKGRGFTAADKAGARRVGVVNEQFAKVYWPGQDPIGKRFRIGSAKGESVEVVGLAKTGKYLFLGESAMTFFYLPYDQSPKIAMTLLVESNGDPTDLAAPMQQLAHSFDPNLPVYNVRTLADYYEKRAITAPRMILRSVMAMGLTGLAIAMMGLYGLIAYTVTRRTAEIGIRIAIGAQRNDILRMVLRQGLTLGVIGVVVGSAISILAARAISAGLVGMATPNAATFIIVPFALMAITLVACYAPAFRASRIDPLIALRYD